MEDARNKDAYDLYLRHFVHAKDAEELSQIGDV